MSFQIQDRYYFNGLQHNLVASSEEFGFNPKKYGFNELGYSHHCHRGYVAIYFIYKNKLSLENLQILVKPESDTIKINDISPIYISSDESLPEITHPYLKTKEDTIIKNHRCNRASVKILFYKDLHFDINYTGKLMLGHDFVPFYSHHNGCYQAWCFNNLYEFEFINGELINILDYSLLMEEIRDEINKNSQWVIAQNYLKSKEVNFWWAKEDTKFHMPAYI